MVDPPPGSVLGSTTSQASIASGDDAALGRGGSGLKCRYMPRDHGLIEPGGRYGGSEGGDRISVRVANADAETADSLLRLFCIRTVARLTHGSQPPFERRQRMNSCGEPEGQTAPVDGSPWFVVKPGEPS